MKFHLSVALLLVAACGPRDTATSPAATDTTLPTSSSTMTDTAAPATPTPERPAEDVPPADDRPRLLPIDRAADDPTFLAYRQQLLAAVKAKDTAALEKLVDPNVRTSFGDGGGWAEFRRHWNLPAADSKLWNELETILRMGGSFAGPAGSPRFCAPYVYSDWPDDVDAFEYLAVIDKNVPLRERAAEGAPLVAEMDFDIVKSLDHDFQKPWRHVQLADGRQGWVRSDKVRSSIQYRACFQKADGEWKMNLLVAGD